MTDSNSLFQATQETPGGEDNQGGSPNTPAASPLDTLLKTIKNERGEQKYRSVEEALVGLSHAQSYIPEVKNELRTAQAQLAELQKQAEKVNTLEQTILELTQRGKEKETPTSSISEESIAGIVASQMQALKQQDVATSNAQTVRNAIIKQFGEKAADVFNAKAAELGMTPEDLTQIAVKSPKAALAMIGVSGDNAPKQFKTSPAGTQVRSDGTPGRAQSLIGNKDAFKLRLGATSSDVMAMKHNSDQLLEELRENGVSVHDMTDPSTYFKIFGNK